MIGAEIDKYAGWWAIFQFIVLVIIQCNTDNVAVSIFNDETVTAAHISIPIDILIFHEGRIWDFQCHISVYDILFGKTARQHTMREKIKQKEIKMRKT